MNHSTLLFFVLLFAKDVENCMFCGRPFTSILPPLPDMNYGFRPYIPPMTRPDAPFPFPLPPLPDRNFGVRPPYIPPMSKFVIPDYKSNSCPRPEMPTIFEFNFSRGCQISPSFRLLAINDDLVANITEAVRDWRYDLVSDFVQDLLAEQTLQSGFTATESAIPPDSLILALMALTIEQQAHITELALRGDSVTLTKILDGIILSLPEEIQAQSIRFNRLLSDILCYSSLNDNRKSLIESLLG